MRVKQMLLGAACAVSALTGCASHAAAPQAVVDQIAGAAPAVAKQMPQKQAYTWRNVQIVAGGFVDGLIFNPAAKNVLYARTDIGEAYRWNPVTHRWIPLLDWLPPADWNLTGVESVGIDPADANRVYLAVGTYTGSFASNGAILRSDDQGRTWKRTDLPFKNGSNMDGRSAGERLAVDPDKDSVLYFGSRNNGLWRSTDYGATWNQVTTFPVTGQTNGTGVVFEDFDTTGGHLGQATQTIYAAVSQIGPGLYRSTDGGTTWQAVPGQPMGLLPQHGFLTATGILYLTYGNAPGPNGMSGGAVWKYDTHSGAWTNITPQMGGFGYAGLAVQAHQPNTVMVATMDRWNPGDTIFRSTDGGKTWEDLRPQSVRDISRSPWITFGAKTAPLGWWLGALALDPFRPGHALYGTGATIWESHDVANADRNLPTHWAIGARGLEETAVLALASPPSGPPLLSALGDIGGFRHDNLNVSPARGMWTNPVITTTTGLDFAELQPNIVVRVGNTNQGSPGAFSLDGAVTWQPFPTSPPGTRGGGTVAVNADGSAIAWSTYGGTFVTRDHGATWTPSAGASRGMNVVSGRVTPADFYGWNGRTGTVFASTDSGANFTARATGLPTGSGKLLAVPGHQGDLWLTANKNLYHSTDGGAHFVPVSTATQVNGFGCGMAAPGHAYPALYLLGTVQGLAGIYRSDDVGATWTLINDPQHQYATADVITGDPRMYGRVYVGTNGRGILYGVPAAP